MSAVIAVYHYPRSVHQNDDGTSRSTARHKLEFIAGSESTPVIGVKDLLFEPVRVKRGISRPSAERRGPWGLAEDWHTWCQARHEYEDKCKTDPSAAMGFGGQPWGFWSRRHGKSRLLSIRGAVKEQEVCVSWSAHRSGEYDIVESQAGTQELHRVRKGRIRSHLRRAVSEARNSEHEIQFGVSMRTRLTWEWTTSPRSEYDLGRVENLARLLRLFIHTSERI